jgi:3-methyladenine DNA glycosylase/8-oxoguanine DNA glycosylase
LTSDPFEGLVWVIVGAQVNVVFAAACRADLCRRAGTPCGDGLHAHPNPAQVAALEPADLWLLRFSRRKAE